MSFVYKPKISLLTKENCIYCIMTKTWLAKQEREWEEAPQSWSVARATFPQIFIDGIFIGGYSALISYPEIIELNMFKPSITYKPFKFPEAVNLSKTHEMMHWVEDEISLTDDVMCWGSGSLSADEKEYAINILQLFTQSDVSVGNLYHNIFIPLFGNNELRCMMSSFAAREGIHQRAYALLNDTLGLPDTIYQMFLAHEATADKISFIEEMKTDSLDNIALSIVKAIFNEGVSLFAAFVMLLNFQRFGKMTGMGKVVEWSIRDESLHVKGMIYLLKTFLACYPFVNRPVFIERVFDLANDVCQVECEFIDLVFKISRENPTGALVIPQLAASDVKEFVQFILNKRLKDMGFMPIFLVSENPLEWVSWIINGTDHTNFFENRVTEYSIAGLTGDWGDAYDSDGDL